MIKQLLIGSLLFLCFTALGCNHRRQSRTAVNHKVIISTTNGACSIDPSQKSIPMYKKPDSHGNHDTLKWCSDSDATYTLKDFKPSIPLTPLQVPTTIDKNCTLPAHVKDDAGLGTYSYTVVDAHGAQCDPNVIVK